MLLLGAEGLSLFQNTTDFSVMRLKRFVDIFFLMPAWSQGGSRQ